MKKKENECVVKTKMESHDEFKCLLCNQVFTSEIDFGKHKLTHSNGTPTNLFNGIIDLDELSDDEEDVASISYGKNDMTFQSSSDALKKEEVSLHEEKIIADNESAMNEKDEINTFLSDSSDQFPFNFNGNDLPADFMDNDNSMSSDGNSVNKEEDNSNNVTTPQHSDHEGDDNDSNNTKNETKILINKEVNESGELTENNYLGDDEDCNFNLDLSEEPVAADEISNQETSKTEESGRESENKEWDSESIDNKRPSSRESCTSTTSTSSERTLTVRSTSQLNNMATDVITVKKEKDADDSVSEKHCVSVKNPSQLGVVDSTAGENLLQSGNFIQTTEQIMSYMPNNEVSISRCDVCEAQFAESIHLKEHRATLGHYKCLLSPECETFVFPTLAEFSAHQQTVHNAMNQSPVQQLAHQVQTLPLRYQMDQSYAQSTQPRSSPVTYPPASNTQVRQYASGSPRYMIGSAVIRSGLPAQNNATKRPMGAPTLTRLLSHAKRGRMDTYPSRNGDADCKVVSVQKPDNTDDVVAQLSKSITITARQETQKKNDTAAVANMLANRGITVSSVPAKPSRSPNPVQILTMNSAVSLIPTNNTTQNRQNSGFAVPQSRLNNNRQAIPGRVAQTVDLTGPEMSRNRSCNRLSKFTCSICDRSFFNQEQLNQHMVIHRSTNRKQLPYRCNLCNAQYPTQQCLQQHKQTCRRDVVASHNEMAIPIVDLKQPGALQRLQAVGINHMIPLNALGSQSSNGTFGIPILPFSTDRNTISNMSTIGVSNILPVGPLKTLGR